MQIRLRHHALIAMTGMVMAIVFSTAAAAQSLPAIPEEPPGPLEQQADILGVGGPLPARLVDPMPVYPGSAMGTGAAGMLTVRLTIDETGAVAAARYAGYDRLALRSVKNVLEAAPMLDETFVESALRAVRTWRYAPPAVGPVAAYVEFGFGPKGTVRVLWHDSKRRGSGIAKSAAQQATLSVPTQCIPRVEPLPLDNVTVVGENIPPPRRSRTCHRSTPLRHRHSASRGWSSFS